MGIASMVIGIVAVICSLFPFCGWFALFPAVVGLVLGIVDVALKAKKNLPRGMSVAGIVLCSVSIVFIIVWTIFFCAATVATAESVAVQMDKHMRNMNDNNASQITTERIDDYTIPDQK